MIGPWEGGTMMTVSEAAELLRLEYAEMPGLALTVREAQRLCNLPSDLTDGALGLLIETGFLVRIGADRYVRRDASSPLRRLSSP
jgi:hypothetical protein